MWWGEGVHFAYVLYDEQELVCKIGYSWKPQLRVRPLSREYRLNLKLISKRKFKHGYGALHYEQKWLKHLKSFCICGEFFSLNQSTMDQIVKDFKKGFFGDYQN